jgi:hypothetical protein
MTNLKSILFFTIFSTCILSGLLAQQTHMPGDNKMSSLLDTKYLKTGEVVLIEEIKLCKNTSIKLLNPDGTENIILGTGKAKFFSFNELEGNNWVFVLVTDPGDDVPVPYTFHTITFIDGGFTIFSTDDDQTDIDLTTIVGSTVINTNELVLNAGAKIHFTDYQLSLINTVQIDKPIMQLKTYNPEFSTMYFRYIGEDKIHQTSDKFDNVLELYTDLGDSFQEFHYLGNVAIFQFEDEIYKLTNSGKSYFAQNKKIYDFRPHGQGLTYYTVSPADPDILFLYKIHSKVFSETSFESTGINRKDFPNLSSLHWDGDFKGIASTFIPLPKDDYEDEYRGANYYLDFTFEDAQIQTQSIDISIDDIKYTTEVDTISISSGAEKYYANINMEIQITNHTDLAINDVHLHSAAFEGINCAHNSLKVDDDIIMLEPQETKIVTAKYKSLEFSSGFLLKQPLCVYIISANNQFDNNFEDNIHCLPLWEFTSTDELSKEREFAVFPNPSQNTIQLKSQQSATSYLIYSVYGNVVDTWDKKSKTDIYDISNLAKGNYFIVEQKTNAIAIFTKI